MLNLKYKIWLEKDGKVFGEGPYDLLKGVEETGSLMGSARAMNMSYSQAHGLIKRIEKRLGFKLINSKKGGKSGGHSSLTKESKQLMKDYIEFKEECDNALNNIFEKYFTTNR